MLVAEHESRVVGLRAFLRWRFHAGNKELTAVRAVDTATHPEYQGQGIFSRLTLAALDQLRNEIDFVFNTPNEKSLPGYLKMGWEVVGRLPIWARIRRPLRFVFHIRSPSSPADINSRPRVDVPSAADVLKDREAVEGLLRRRPERRSSLISTSRSYEFLWWRYAEAPLLDYRAVTERGADGLRGLAIFRVRPRGPLWESTLAELLVADGDRSIARALLHHAAHAAGVDHVTFHFGNAPVAPLSAGFVRLPRGMTFVVNKLGKRLEPDPALLSNWSLSLGDLEVF